MGYIHNVQAFSMVWIALMTLATFPSTVPAALLPVPGSSMVFQGVLYNIQAADGSYLDLDNFKSEDFWDIPATRDVSFKFRQELFSINSSNFVFQPREGTNPGLAGISGPKSDELYHFLFPNDNSIIYGDAGTLYKPKLFCYSSFFSSRTCKDYYRVSLKQKSYGDDPQYLIGFSDNEQLIPRRYISKQDDPQDKDKAEKQQIAILVDNESKAMLFRFVPVTEGIKFAITSFNSETDITGNANDIKMALDEVILNRANIRVEHVYSKTMEFTSVMKLSEEWSTKQEVSVKVEAEASTGFAGFGSASVKTSIEGKGSEEVGGKQETTISSVETFMISQTVSVEPGKAVRCTSWVKVVQGAQMPYRAEAHVKMFFRQLDPLSGEFRVKAMPPQLVLALVPYYISGWTILRATETGVMVEMTGTMTASFGVNAFFSSEDIKDDGLLLARNATEQPKSFFDFRKKFDTLPKDEF